jgi:hypothetical protein
LFQLFLLPWVGWLRVPVDSLFVLSKILQYLALY